MDEPKDPVPPALPAPADGRAHRWRTAASWSAPLLWVLGSALVVLLLVGATLQHLLWRDSGSRWLLAQLPGVKVEGWSGGLLGERWQAERVRIEWNGGASHATLSKLDAQGLRWQLRPSPSAWAGLHIGTLSIGRIDVVSGGPPSSAPPTLPASIALPAALSVARGQIGSVHLGPDEMARDITLQDLLLDPEAGGAHRIGSAALTAQGLRATASGSVGTQAPLPLNLKASITPAPDSTLPAWRADITLGGDARASRLQARLTGPAASGQGPTEADLSAELRPLEPWPVQAAELRSQALDLAALHPSLPLTRLAGTARLRMSGRGQPAELTLDLRNSAAGSWSRQRVPVAELTAELVGSSSHLGQADRFELKRAEAVLADGSRSAGRLALQGLWESSTLTLDARLADVAPGRLDNRAPAMLLAGPVQLRVEGLALPAALSASAPAATSASSPASAPAPSPSPSPSTGPPPAAPKLHAEIDLTGRFDGAPQPVRLSLQADIEGHRIDITRLRALAGNAQADARLTLNRSGLSPRADWRLVTAGSVVDFDPLPWWPGEATSPWRRGPHRLSGGWDFDGRLPHNAQALQPLALLQKVVGNGRLRITDSQLAGVPVAADVTLGYTQAAAPQPALVRGELRLGGNVLKLDGRADPAGSGSSDRLALELQADALPNLAPLFALHPASAAWAPRQGRIQTTLQFEGRWPALKSSGNLSAAQLQLGAAGAGAEPQLRLGQASASWQFDGRASPGADPRLQANAELLALQVQGQRAEFVRAQVDGTLAEHRIDIAGAAALLPPADVLKALGVGTPKGSRLQLQAQGGWRSDGATGGGRWQARLQRLLLGGWDGNNSAAAPLQLWAQLRDVDAAFDFAAGGTLKAISAAPGRAVFGDVMALRWEAVSVQFGAGPGGRTDVQLRADIEPFRVVPLLKRVQSGTGWEGDLRLAARLDVRAGERFEADAVFEREGGDLHINGSEGLLLMGLTELRLGVVARDGRWTLTPVFRGRSLGEVSGSLQLQASREARVPPSDAPLSGSVQARVADIGIWGPWVPAGWRLGGELRTQVALGGTLKDPRLTGDLSGSKLGVRNLLQGVNIQDGQLALKLDGDRARIEAFTMKSGDGQLAISGEAQLGTEPRLRLVAEATRFRVIGRVDRQAVASGSATLNLSRERGALDGRFRIDEGFFDAGASDAPSLDDDVTVMRPGEAERAEREEQAQRRNFQLALDLDLGERLRVRGRGIDTGLRGAIKLTTPGGRLAVNGSIRTDEGNYAAYGQKLTVERGIITFTGPVDDPRLDILALRPNIDMRVGVAITGTALSPRVRLFSEPELGETEKLSWLVLGRAPDGLGRNDTALLQRAAVALLAGEGNAPTDQLMSRLGIDDLSLRQGDSDVRETVISLGKQLSRRWYLGYERGVNSTTGTWQLTYRIAQRFTLRAQSGLENSLDVIWTWRFQETPADASMRKSTIAPR